MKINNKSAASRRTRQRAALRAVFEAAEGPLTPQEACARAGQSGAALGIATAYRAVARWVTSGWLIPVEIPGKAGRYERRDLAHHHHFHCDGCQRVYDVAGCAQGLGRLVPAGFSARAHHITIRGLCRTCRDSARRSARPGCSPVGRSSAPRRPPERSGPAARSGSVPAKAAARTAKASGANRRH